jgi:hypothetical protein
MIVVPQELEYAKSLYRPIHQYGSQDRKPHFQHEHN